VEIYDSSNNLVASYTYDAWGNCTFGANIDNIANVNPFRYRGYYYDWETRYYYLQTRYYDAEVGRFINADSIEYLDPETINGCNLYAYGLNNPIEFCDPSGESIILTCLLIGAIAGGIVGGVIGGVTAYNLAEETGAQGAELAVGTVLGVIGGAAIFGVIGAGIGASVGIFISGVISSIGATIASGGMSFALASGGAASTAATVAVATSVVNVATVGVVLGLGISNVLLMSKPNSGRIRYSDDTGLKPDGTPYTDPDEARAAYKAIKDPARRLRWKRWLKGKGWYNSHMDGFLYLGLVGEWLRRMLEGDW